MTGIITIAAKHPYYGNAAYDLALSLRFHQKDLDITVIADERGLAHLAEKQKEIFNSIIPLPVEKCKRKGNLEVLMAKFLLHELSPYDNTLFLDADTLWLPVKSIVQMLKELSGTFQMANRGEVKHGNGVSEWINLKEVYSKYSINHWYDLSSEFIYFEKSEKVKKFFDDALKYHLDDSIGTVEFAGGKPDEVGFGVAVEKNNIKLKSPFMPSYWQPYYTKTQKKIYGHEHIKKNFYLVSAGGASTDDHIKKLFHDLTKFYYYRAGVKMPPRILMNKSKLIAERKKI